MAQFNYTKFLKEGGVEKYLMEADFGNDPQSRYDFIRPLMSRLPDTARTEYLIDALEDALADYNRTDDLPEKMEFDNVFIEIMKALGMESELAEADSLVNPEAEEIEASDLDAAADYFDSLAENDDVLDEMLAEGDIQVGDLVYFKGHEDKVPMKVLKVRRMFGSNLDAITTEKGEYDETQLVRAKRAVDMGGGTFQVSEEEEEDETPKDETPTKRDTRQNVDRGENRGFSIYDLEEVDVEGYVQTENKLLKASNTLEDALNKVADDLTDEQIDKFTEMILDLRDKVKAGKK